MGCRGGPDVLVKRKSVASAGNPNLDRRPARSIITMLMVEILKTSVQARMMTVIWVITVSSTARGTWTCEDVLLSGLVRTTVGIKQ